MPSDIGGAGSYTHFTSSLGSTTSYVERFRGDDDFAAQLSKRLKSADSLADLVVGWMTAELGQDPKFPRLKKFLDEDLRRDLRNVGIYACTNQATENFQTPHNGEFLVRAGQYLCERGYFSPKEAPLLFRVLSDGDPKPLLADIQRFVARKMGVADSQAIPASLDFLGDPAKLEASFGKYAQSSELIRERLKASKSQEVFEDKAGSEEITPVEAADEFLFEFAELAGWDISLGCDQLDLKLFGSEKPYATNGEWDEKNATVTWSNRLDTDRLPVVCFALWSTPDRPFQQAHFAKVLLTGEELAQYVIWYRSLKPEEVKEWDQFVSGLKPGPDLKVAIAAFRFSTDPKMDPNESAGEAASLATIPRSLILERLEAKPGDTK
jgi:hypothetical protein